MKEPVITDLDSLKRAQDRLRIIIETKENELSASLNYFRTNHRSILWSYINPLKGETNLANIISMVTGGATGLSAGVVPLLLNQSVRRFLVRSGMNLFKKIIPKKKKDSESEKSE